MATEAVSHTQNSAEYNVDVRRGGSEEKICTLGGGVLPDISILKIEAKTVNIYVRKGGPTRNYKIRKGGPRKKYKIHKGGPKKKYVCKEGRCQKIFHIFHIFRDTSLLSLFFGRIMS